MSAPRLISPMLDGFSMGEAISSHNGVTCYPAMRENLDDKYIVKVISVPASEVQLAALLLSGAYSNREEALRYYKSRAQEIVQEVRTMNSLGNLEGFVPYLDCQITEKEDGNGYEVYLLNTYQKSLEQVFCETVMTHRIIMNLAMDLCTALAACRRAGYLYIDLKPTNIFHSEEHGYRISDLGLLPLATLKYASLPEKYHSVYTAPEITDAVSQLNTTMDVYALGLVLYQAYNGGSLNLEDGKLPDPLLPPVYADYEMAEIILRACHPDPAIRWADPVALGQALAQYMQRNPVTDSPIIPAAIVTPELDTVEEFLPEEPMDEQWDEITEFDHPQAAAEVPEEIPEDISDEEIAQMLAQADDLIAHALPEPVVAPEAVEIPMPEPPILDIAEEPEAPVLEIPLVPDIQPEPEVLPETQPQPEPQPEPEAQSEPEQPEVPQEAPVPVETPPQEPIAPPAEKPHRPIGRWILAIVAIVLVAGLVIGGGYYYENYYLQTIDSITVQGDQTSVTVKIDTDADESLLTVLCSDAYGNTFKSPVVNGTAHFVGLAPQTHYSIRITMDGFHKLTGQTTGSYATPNQTNILSFTASIGPVDGSVYLNFMVSGVESDEWIITYHSASTDPQSVSFAGHSVTIYDLRMGEDYTFSLSAADGANVVGQTQVSFTSRTIVKAQNPVITACGNGKLTVEWTSPDGENVSSWTVHCFDESGFEQTVTTDGNSYTFTGMDHHSICTVEILAEGMNQGVSVQIQADPINISQFQHNVTISGIMVNWIFTGNPPESGWVLSWNCDGSAVEIITTEIDSVILPYIPGGNYVVSLFAADGSPIFGHSYTFTVPEASTFQSFGVTAEHMTFMMCATSSMSDWEWDDIDQEDYRSQFAPGETAGFIVWCEIQPEAAAQEVEILYVVRGSQGNLVSTTTEHAVWSELWDQNFCELSIPQMPYQTGEYTISIYIDGTYLHTQTFQII